MTASVGTVTVEVKPDADALAKAVREGVAGVLRALADEIEKGTEPTPAIGTLYTQVPMILGRYRDREGDPWRLTPEGWALDARSVAETYYKPEDYLPFTRTGDL